MCRRQPIAAGAASSAITSAYRASATPHGMLGSCAIARAADLPRGDDRGDDGLVQRREERKCGRADVLDTWLQSALAAHCMTRYALGLERWAPVLGPASGAAATSLPSTRS
jgi:hypothetical protein